MPLIHEMCFWTLLFALAPPPSFGLPEVSVNVLMPIENETYPCGVVHPVVSLGFVEDEKMVAARAALTSRSWLMCYALSLNDEILEQFCAPLGSKILHAMEAPAPAQYKFEMWLTHLSDDGAETQGTGRISRFFWCSSTDQQDPLLTAAVESASNLDLRCVHPTRGFGTLARHSGDNGALSFPTHDGEAQARELVILLRIAPRSAKRLRAKNALYDVEPQVNSRSLPQLVVVLALVKALEKLADLQHALTTVVILPNGFGTQNSVVGRWIQRTIHMSLPAVEVLIDENVPAGNAESFNYQSQLVSSISKEDAILFALEDDVVLQPSALTEMVDFFQSHDPCLVNLVDTPLLYSGDAHFVGVGKSASYLVAGRHRHWRTTDSTTTTFAVTKRTYQSLKEADLLPDPENDFAHSNAIALSFPGSILSPLPSLATPIERVDQFSETHIALYFNYIEYAAVLLAGFDNSTNSSDLTPPFLLDGNDLSSARGDPHLGPAAKP